MNPSATVVDWSAAVTGGSGTTIHIGRDMVCKVATPAGLAKLRSEASWLDWIGSHRDPAVRIRFPRVLAPPTEADPMLVLERLPGVDARTAILSGRQTDVRPLVADAVRFAFETLVGVAPAVASGSAIGTGTAEVAGGATPGRVAPGVWCANHLSDSLRAASDLRSSLGALFEARRLVLADCALPNPLYGDGRHTLRLLAGLRVPQQRIIHGDLHLGNIMVDLTGGGFHLVDPRGDWGGQRHFDPAYDVAKLLHEVHYVAARSRLVRLRLDWDATALHIVSVGDHGAMPAALGALAHTSRSLALAACRSMAADDPLLPARATVLTGVLLLSVLRLGNIGDEQWETLLGHGLSWLASGVQAVTHRLGLGRCQVLWDALLADIVPNAWSGVSVGRWLEQD